MLRKSLMITQMPITILPSYRKRCVLLTNFVIAQCLLVYIGSATILSCMWSPDKSSGDYNKLLRIMYLYDYDECGHKLHSIAHSNIRLSNETYGLDLKPITWKQAVVTVSTRLSWKTRRLYIELSLAIHIIWMTTATGVNIIMRTGENVRFVKFILSTFFYVSLSVVAFDISMAIVYVAHIQQSLTKGMVLRYSGWGVELKLQSYEEFAGWLPIAASVMWLRGIVILCWNVYSCRIIGVIREKIKNKEVRTRLMWEGYLPIPEADNDQSYDTSVLYYRAGENKPFIRQNMSPKTFKRTTH